MTTTPNFRTELEKLVDLYEALGGNWSPHGYTDTWNDALTSARAALATPPPEPPTDEELYEYWISTSPQFGCADPIAFARAALERWGHG